MSLESQRDKKIASCKQLAGWRIVSEYPDYKQRNIDAGRRGKTQFDRDKMNTFIEAVGDRCDSFEAQINASDDPGSIVIDYSDIKP